MQITISNKALTVASLFAAKNDIRQYLNGALLSITPEKNILVSTCGGAMSVQNVTVEKIPLSEQENQETFNEAFIIPLDVLTHFKPNKVNDNLTLSFDIPEKEGYDKYEDTVFTLTNCFGESKIFKMIQGHYPDYRRVCTMIDVSKKNVAQKIDPKFLVAVSKAAKILTNDSMKYAITQYGSESSHVNIGKTFFGVIMPYRTKGDLDAIVPEWI